MKVRILWVRPGDRSMSPGDLLDSAEVAERGYRVEDLVERGEAEPVSPGSPKPQLDHDGDGRPGGSKKGSQSTASRGRRKKG